MPRGPGPTVSLILAVALCLSCGASSIPPGIYLQDDACSTIRHEHDPPEPDSQWVDVVRWCVPWVEVTGAGSLVVRAEWSTKDSLGVEVGPFDEGALYLVDLLGRRLESVDERGGAVFGARLSSRAKQVAGLFTFPLPSRPVTRLALVDIASGSRVRGIRFDPERRARVGAIGRVDGDGDLEPEGKLRLALQRGDAEAVLRLLDGGSDPNTRFLWDDETPITVAALNGHTQIVRTLIERGGDPGTITPRGDALAVAARADDVETARVLLEAGVDTEHRFEEMTPLDVAMQRSHDEMVELLAREWPGGPGAGHDFALYYAAVRGDAALAERLLETGTRPEPVGRSLPNRLPLQVAVFNRDRPLMRVLLEHGADPSGLGSWGATPLGSAVIANDLELMRLFIQAGADLEVAIADDTPLMRALTPEAVKILADAGADVNARDRSGRTVLMRLAANACGPGSRRPQYCQSERHDIPDAVLQLLEYDVDVDATDPRGRTALDLAAADGQTEMVRLLRERFGG